MTIGSQNMTASLVDSIVGEKYVHVFTWMRATVATPIRKMF